MAHSATLGHGQAYTPGAAKKSQVPQRAVLADPGPWLVLLGPVSIALIVLAVSWISLISF